MKAASALALTLALLTQPVMATGIIYQTVPGSGSAIDYSKRGLVVEGNGAYPTLPGTTVRDYSQRGYVSEDGGMTVQQTYPGSNVPDYSQSGYSTMGMGVPVMGMPGF